MVGIRARSLGTTLLISVLLPLGVSPASAQAAKPTSRPAPRAANRFLRRIVRSVTGAMPLAANPVPT